MSHYHFIRTLVLRKNVETNDLVVVIGRRVRCSHFFHNRFSQDGKWEIAHTFRCSDEARTRKDG